MLTVETDPGAVEERLRSGGLACPGCAGVLAGWGRARQPQSAILETLRHHHPWPPSTGAPIAAHAPGFRPPTR
jgi:hypothetical protein